MSVVHNLTGILYITVFIGFGNCEVSYTRHFTGGSVISGGKLTTLPDDLVKALHTDGVDEALIHKLALWQTSSEYIQERAFTSFENLKELKIFRSPHLRISKCAFSQSNLEIISVLKCGLASLPTTCILEKVKTLDLGHNKMTYVESHAFSSYVSLGELSLRENEITHIEPGAFTGTKIFRLILAHNKLKCIPDLRSISSTLLHLYIQSNHIDGCSIEPQNHTFPLLYVLRLKNNALSNLPPMCYQAPALLALYIDDNNFETVKDFRNVAPYLSRVDFSNNPIVCDCKVAWLKDVNQDMTKYGTVQCSKSGPNPDRDWRDLYQTDLEDSCLSTTPLMLVHTSEYTDEHTTQLSTIATTYSTAPGKTLCD